MTRPTLMTGFVITFWLALGLPYSILAENSTPMQVRVEVSEAFEALTARNVQMDTYVESLGEGVVDSADVSLDYGERVTIRVRMSTEEAVARDRILFDGMFFNDGFDEQLHLEMFDNGELSVEVCDSLADVPRPMEDQGGTGEVLKEVFPARNQGKTVSVEVNF